MMVIYPWTWGFLTMPKAPDVHGYDDLSFAFHTSFKGQKVRIGDLL